MIAPTPAQIAIRDAAELALLITAPAGCGKTEAMALRVAGLLERGQVAAPRKILVATFTNRARDNIRNRLKDYLNPAQMRDRITVNNFHGLAARLYGAHANVIGMDPGLLLPDGDWVAAECRTRNLDYKRSEWVRDLIQKAKQNPYTDEQVEAALIETGDAVAVDIERNRREEGQLTYDDLPRLAELILQNPVVAQLYANHFACLLVDEFQDLTPQQLRIVNSIGLGRTTYAGDLAQGIYGFAGADPNAVYAQIKVEVAKEIVFAESHRSSPAVLDMVNALEPIVHGESLSCAVPSSWPGGGVAGMVGFDSTDAESRWIVSIAKALLNRAPNHRVGVIARTASRRRFADQAFESSGLAWYRWDDPLLDGDAVRAISRILDRIVLVHFASAADGIEYLRSLADQADVQDPIVRTSVSDALDWVFDKLKDGSSPKEIQTRLKEGNQAMLITAPGVHLLSGHAGKGQQFDWVIVVGMEDGTLPFYLATTDEAYVEEACVLSVMMSRARHGVILTRSERVEDKYGRPRRKDPSPFLHYFDGLLACRDHSGILSWFKSVDWAAVAAR